MKYLYLPIRTTKIKNNDPIKCWWRCGEAGLLTYPWWECKIAQPLWKGVRTFLLTVNKQLPYHPASALVGIYPRKMKTCVHTKTCTQVFTVTLFIIKDWQQSRCPPGNECLNKLWYILTTEYSSAIKRNKQLPHTNCDAQSWSLYGSIHMTFVRWWNYGHGQQLNGCQIKVGSWHGYKRSKWGVLVVKDTFCILIVSMPISCLWCIVLYGTAILWDVTVGGNWIKGRWDLCTLPYTCM